VSARNRLDGASFEQVTERLPVLIGRDPTVATVVLPDNLKVSRVHASLELRGDELYVRDARSVNGTVVGGQPIPPETWVPLGRGDVPREFAISDWLFTVVCVQPPQAVTVADNSFGNEAGHRVLGLHATIATAALADTGPAQFGHDGRPLAPEPDRVESAYEQYRLASKALYELLVQELDAMSIGERRAAATVMARRFSMLVDDPAFAALLRNYGATLGPTPSSPPPAPSQLAPAVAQVASQLPPIAMGATQPMAQVAVPPPPARLNFPGPVTSPEGVALKAMQYLSTWYVGRAAVTTADIGSFTDQLRATLDELMRGHVPLLAGLDRFEQQLALSAEDGGFELPRTPVDFARALLDWNDTSGNPVRALRRSFADLMVHQVGMLNGIMRGVKVLLTELSPATIEHAWNVKNDRRTGLARLFGRWHKEREMLAMLAERHSDLADEENETFRLLFGPEFVREYKLLAQEQAQSMRPQQLAVGGTGAPGGGPGRPVNGPGPGFDGNRTYPLRR
jgi:predicted component of type VI protein secretion system